MDTVRSILSWVLALVLIALFVQATIHPLPDPPPGQVKLFDEPGENIVFQLLAQNSGIALFEPAGRFLTACLELLAAFLLLFPFSRRLGAGLSAAILGGAVALHLSPWLGREVPVSLEQGAATDGGQLFMLAVGMLVISVLLLFIHQGRRREQ